MQPETPNTLRHRVTATVNDDRTASVHQDLPCLTHIGAELHAKKYHTPYKVI